MEIIVACPSCEYELHLPDRGLLGRKAKCPKCEHKFVMEESHARPAAQPEPPPVRPAPPAVSRVPSSESRVPSSEARTTSPEKSKAVPEKPKGSGSKPVKPGHRTVVPGGKTESDSYPITPPSREDFESLDDLDSVEVDSESGHAETPTLDGLPSVSQSDSAAIPDDIWDELRSEKPGDEVMGSSILSPAGVVARCPHCHAAVDFRRDDELRDYPCGRCERHFSLIHPETPPEALTMPAQVGMYQLQKHPRIGVGPFGNVYRAKDGQDQEAIVIKVSRGDQVSDREMEKFLAVLRSVMQLKHPSIAALREADQAEGRVYLVSNYVSGLDLSEYLLQTPGRQLAVREVASVCALIASVLHHAHKFGVVHGNLKPSNIRLDGNQKPYLIDFGLNHRQNGVLVTGNGRSVGTAAYLAPEQLPGPSRREPDAQTDVFALGVIFYELLTGRRPFPGEGPDLFKQIARGTPEHPRSLNSQIPKTLDIICMKCLEVDPRDRYQSAMDVYKELRLYLEDKPIQTKPPGLLTRFSRWCRRRPIMAGMLLTVLFLAVAGAGFVGWRMWQHGGFS